MENSGFQSNMGTDYLMEKKLEIMMDINNKKIANEINILKGMISSLSNEISEIRQNINKSKTAVINKPMVCEEISEEPEAVKISRAAPAVASASKDNVQVKPRYGEYGPQDVSIEKFFYSGSKR